MSAPGLKITNFHYSNTQFEPNVYQEYPKWIHMSGYPSEVVQDREGEERLLARPAVPGDVAVPLEPAKADATVQSIAEPEIFINRDREREVLLELAREKNIKVDARWKTDRIRETIEKAG